MRIKIFLLLTVLSLCTGCSASVQQRNVAASADTTRTQTVIDYNQRQVEIPADPHSVICSHVGALRFTTYLDAVDLVIGIEQNELEKNISKPYNYIHHEYLSALPVIGNNGEVYLEEVAKLAPDVIVTSLDQNAAQSLQDKLGIPVVTIPLVDNFLDDSCTQALTILGQVYQKEERAHELIQYIQDIRNDLLERTQDIPTDQKPSVYVGGIAFKGLHGFEGTEANYSPFVALGAKNIADKTGQTGPFNIDLEAVLAQDPDIIFLDHNGLALIQEDYQANPEYYAALSAVKNDAVYSQVSFRFSAINIELALADAYYAGSVIFPEYFRDIDPEDKANEIFRKFLGVSFYEELETYDIGFRSISLEN